MPKLAMSLCVLALWADRGMAQKLQETWTDPHDPTLPADYKIQGEYVGSGPDGGKLGCQVIALGEGSFQAVLLPGGLPGAGWNEKEKILLDGRLEGTEATFKATTGKRRYLARSLLEFAATAKFPTTPTTAYTATINGETLTGNAGAGKPFTLKRTLRQSPSQGAKPNQEAIVLFDGTNTDQWSGGRLDKASGHLHTDGHDIVSRRKFLHYSLHLEFMLPYRPQARGQDRGNSGVYQADLYEVQVLDSFGLDGKDNECGGIYGLAPPRVNMCLPPLTWQTYDIDFRSAAVDESGKKLQNARITVKHNGVVIHDNLELKSVTGGARDEPEGTPGPIRLQGHSNPLQYRNIWVVEKK